MSLAHNLEHLFRFRDPLALVRHKEARQKYLFTMHRMDPARYGCDRWSSRLWLAVPHFKEFEDCRGGSYACPRIVKIEGDKLFLSTESPIKSGGKIVMSHVQWQRADKERQLEWQGTTKICAGFISPAPC